MKALILVADGVEDSEFLYPYYRLKEEGIEVDVAGAAYVDEEVVVDGNLITSRCPSDLPAFSREIFTALG